MSGVPKLPDLASLSEAQKDELIVSLWDTLNALDGTSASAASPAAAAALAAPGSGLAPATEPSTGISTDLRDRLRARLRATAPSRRGHSPGAGRGSADRSARLAFLEWRWLQILLLVVGLAFLADYAIGVFQRRDLAARQQADLALRAAAAQGLYVELVRITQEPDGTSYRATLVMQNLSPAEPLYVMLSPVRVFVQAGLAWQEVPSQAPAGTSWGVVKLESGKEYSVVFQAELTDWSQLIPGYMHVLLQSDMLISRSAEPTDDIVARNNRFYVYLKPHGADDAAIKSRSNFPGTPPVFIPMPPH